MAKILVGIPWYKPTEDFLESLPKFLDEISQYHDIDQVIIKGKSLVDAQNMIADEFLASDKDYLLFLETDHSGHTKEMLDSLLEPNVPICSIKYYSRHYPYYPCHLNSSGRTESSKRYRPYPIDTTGYVECSILPFGMTLIRRDTFSLLDKPYFRINVHNDGTIEKIATDRNFSDRLTEKGIKLIACFDHCLTHCGIDDTNIKDCRIKGNELYGELLLINRLKRNKGKEETTIADFFNKHDMYYKSAKRVEV